MTDVKHSHRPLASHVSIVALLCLGAVFYFSGLRQTLPYIYSIDEPHLVKPAVAIAAGGGLNPHWFGNPGSTVIYPLALVYYVAHSLSAAVSGGQPDVQLLSTFAATPAPFYLLGRVLTAGYGLLSLALLYSVGRRVFDSTTALLAVFLATMQVVTVFHAQQIRTDTAGLFFGLLTLWTCLRLYDQPSALRRVQAGFAVGLAAASRYFMAICLLMLLATEMVIIWRNWRQTGSLTLSGGQVVLGLVSSVIAFAASTPYFFLDYEAALQSLQIEARSTHPGADGLGTLGNFLWYVTCALPNSLSWPQLGVAVLAAVLLAKQRRAMPLFIAGFVLAFLVGISMHPLHWQRWAIPVFPLLSLLAAYPLKLAASSAIVRPSLPGALLVACVGFVVITPAIDTARYALQQTGDNTRIQARTWILQNLPAGSVIAQEEYGALLMGTSMNVIWKVALAPAASLDSYRSDGVQYLVFSSYMYDRYLDDPKRYPSESAFYNEAFNSLPLLVELKPSTFSGGPTIRVYRLSTD